MTKTIWNCATQMASRMPKAATTWHLNRRRWQTMNRELWWLSSRNPKTNHRRRPLISKCFGYSPVHIRHQLRCTPSNNWIIHRLPNFCILFFRFRSVWFKDFFLFVFCFVEFAIFRCTSVSLSTQLFFHFSFIQLKYSKLPIKGPDSTKPFFFLVITGGSHIDPISIVRQQR